MSQYHSVSAVADTSASGKGYSVIREVHIDGTLDALFVVGDQIGRGRARWVTVTRANTGAQKNTAVLAALNA